MEINKINNQIKVEKGPQRLYEITVKDVKTGEIKYQQIGFAGLLCTVEKIISFQDGIVAGNHQSLGWGHPLIEFYALERLHEFVKETRNKLMAAIKELAECKDDEERMKKIQGGE